MEDLSKYTPTELLKMINDTNVRYDRIKEEIIKHTYEIDDIEKKINDKVVILDELEKKYIAMIEEMNCR